MAPLSLLSTAAACGVHTPISVLQDVMVYGFYQTKSLRGALAEMEHDCIADPDTLHALLGLTASASITAVAPDVSGLLHTINFSLTLTNLAKESVEIESAQFLVVDSGGCVLGAFALYGQNTILQFASQSIPPGGVESGSQNLQWGGGGAPFDFVVSIHCFTSSGARHHLLRRIPILRHGFASPPNIATPSPVFVGLWNRPVEVINVWRDGAVRQWLTMGGQIVNLARQGVSITADVLQFRISSETQTIVDFIVPNQFFRFSDGKLIPPDPDGRVPLVTPQSVFVFGQEVQLSGAKPTLRVDLRYTMTVAGQSTQGKAAAVLPISLVPPAAVIAPPVKSSPVGDWNWGNGPDHTGVDTHASPGEHYCYDLTVQNAQGATFAGTCVAQPDGTHTGDCTKNTSFFDYGLPVLAAKPGTVVLEAHNLPENSGFDKNPATKAGNFVVIDHHDSSFAGYFHCQPLVNALAAGTSVSVGTQLSDVGNSGGSTQPHLHFGYVVVHPTGRAVIAPVAFKNLTTLDGTPVTVVPGNGKYKS